MTATAVRSVEVLDLGLVVWGSFGTEERCSPQ
jgi:hypothetical protein